MFQVLVLLNLILVSLLMIMFRRPKNYPDGPYIFPVGGKYPPGYPWGKGKHILEIFNDLQKEYGSLIGYGVYSFKAVVVNGYEGVMEIINNEHCQGRPDLTLEKERFADKKRHGVLFNDGSEWHTNRRFTLHHLRNLGFGRKIHEPFLEEESRALIKTIEDTNEEPFSLIEKAAKATINTSLSLTVGFRLEHDNPMLDTLQKSFYIVNENSKATGSYTLLNPFLRHLFPRATGLTEIKESVQDIYDFIKDPIEKSRKSVDASTIPRDLIDAYMIEIMNLKNKEVNENEKITEIQMEAILMDILIAGTPTTSGTITFAIMYLATYPEKQEKMQRELDTVLGEGVLPKYGDRARLPYSGAVLNEILRLRDPLPFMIPHRTTKTVNIMGKTIPKDTLIMPNAYSVRMDEKYWGDPYNFRPERFIDSKGNLINDNRVLSFGRGKRSCLGEAMGRMMIFMYTTALVKSFKFKWAYGEVPDLKGELAFTLKPPRAKLIAISRS